MMKKVFLAFMSLILLVSFTGMTHTVHYCKMKVAALRGEYVPVAMDDADDADGCCATEAPALPADKPVVAKKVEECCVSSVVGSAMQYDSPAPDAKHAVSADIILMAPQLPELAASLTIPEQPFNSPVHSPPRDIPVLYSALLI